MATRLPVLLLVRELGIGGCERDVTKIASGLDRERFEPHVGTFHPYGLRLPELEAAGIPILHLPVRSFRSWSCVQGAAILRQYLRKHKIQIVHSYDVPMNLFGAPMAWLFRTPVVITSQLGYRTLFRPGTRKLLRLTDQISDRLVVNCEAMRRHLIEDEKVPAERTFLCYNGVDTRVFHPAADRNRPERLAGAALVIGSVCALREEKRLDLLVDAFARVRHLRPGMKLLIVGSGVLLPDLQQQAERLGVMEDCIFEPATSNVVPWMQAIDIFVLPSRSEAFSNSLLEAMACGCAPVASRVGGLPELIPDDKTGLLFEPENGSSLTSQLLCLIADDDLRRRLGGASARRARETFSIQRAVQTMSDFYAGLVSDHSGGGTRQEAGSMEDNLLRSS